MNAFNTSLAWLAPVAIAVTSLLILVALERKLSSQQGRASPWPCSKSAPSIPVAADPVRVRASHAGFAPSQVTLSGRHRVVFRRIDNTCASVVVFPELGIEKQLPLNRDVVIDLPSAAHGEFAFQCSMGKYRGKIAID